MSSRFYFFIHSLGLILLSAFSLSSIFLAFKYPYFFSSDLYLATWLYFSCSMLMVWTIFGYCPLTLWEKEALKRENREVYTENMFLSYWSRSMLGINIKEGWVNIVFSFLYCIPIVVGLWVKHFYL